MVGRKDEKDHFWQGDQKRLVQGQLAPPQKYRLISI